MKLPFVQVLKKGPLVEADADALTAAFGDGAYDEARTRAREERLGRVVDSNRPHGHWDRVRQEIGRRIGRHTGLDSATRYSGE